MDTQNISLTIILCWSLLYIGTLIMTISNPIALTILGLFFFLMWKKMSFRFSKQTVQVHMGIYILVPDMCCLYYFHYAILSLHRWHPSEIYFNYPRSLLFRNVEYFSLTIRKNKMHLRNQYVCAIRCIFFLQMKIAYD